MIDPEARAEELCACGHPRRQHMSTTGPCCHLEPGDRSVRLTCEACITFTPQPVTHES